MKFLNVNSYGNPFLEKENFQTFNYVAPKIKWDDYGEVVEYFFFNLYIVVAELSMQNILAMDNFYPNLILYI